MTPINQIAAFKLRRQKNQIVDPTIKPILSIRRNHEKEAVPSKCVVPSPWNRIFDEHEKAGQKKDRGQEKAKAEVCQLRNG
jgi:hypothetical protein